MFKAFSTCSDEISISRQIHTFLRNPLKKMFLGHFLQINYYKQSGRWLVVVVMIIVTDGGGCDDYSDRWGWL